MIVENIIPRNIIINLGCASVDNQIPRDDIFDYHPRMECNIYIILSSRWVVKENLDPLVLIVLWLFPVLFVFDQVFFSFFWSCFCVIYSSSVTVFANRRVCLT